MENSFDPPTTSDGQPYGPQEYKNIFRTQVMISYLSNGSISIADTDALSPFDKDLLLNALMDIKEQERKAIEDRLRK